MISPETVAEGRRLWEQMATCGTGLGRAMQTAQDAWQAWLATNDYELLEAAEEAVKLRQIAGRFAEEAAS